MSKIFGEKSTSHLIQKLRRQKEDIPLEEMETVAPSSSGQDPETALYHKQLRQLLAEALREVGLTLPEKEVLEKHFFDNKSTAEIALETGIKEGVIKKYLNDAITKLQGSEPFLRLKRLEKARLKR